MKVIKHLDRGKHEAGCAVTVIARQRIRQTHRICAANHVFRVLTPLAGLVVTACPALGGGGLTVKSVTIVNTGPMFVRCDHTITINVCIVYHDNAFGSERPSTTIEIKEFDGGGGDDILGKQTITSTGIGSHVEVISFTLGCAPPNGCKCDFYGSWGADDEHGGGHRIYARSQGRTSAIEVVSCVKPCGAVAVNLPAVESGSDAVLTASLVGIGDNCIAGMDYGLVYDETLLSVTDASFSPEVEQLFTSTSVDYSVPGIVRFIANNPTNVVLDPFEMFINVYISSPTPCAGIAIDTDPGTRFWDENGFEVDVAGADDAIHVAPSDDTPPIIDSALLTADLAAGRISGAPGAISDDSIPPPPGCDLRVRGLVEVVHPGDPDLYAVSEVVVASDGSFVSETAPLDNAEDVFLTAIDSLGNRDTVSVSECVPVPSAPSQDWTPIPADTGYGTKNRYLTFAGGDPGEMLGARVTFASLPGYEYAESRTMWVQEPFPVTEASGSNGPTPTPTFWAAELGCDPYYTDWTVYDRVDVCDDGIVPGGSYDVQFIHFDCPSLDEEYFSDPLTVYMSWPGDVVGDCGVTPCTAPQGVIDFVDISAVVEKFKNEPGAPRKARADIINSDVSQPKPDRKVDFVDISCTVEAFRGTPCVSPGPPVAGPCQ